MKAGVQHQVAQSQGAACGPAPRQAFETFGPRGGIAEAAGVLNGLRRRVILAGKAEHGAAHLKAGRRAASGSLSPSSQAA